MSLLTENNRQYYEGAQGFRFDPGTTNFGGIPWTFTTTFDTDLVFSSYNPLETNYALNNFKLYSSQTATPGSWTEYTDTYNVTGNKITLGIVTTPTNIASSPQSYVDVATSSLTSTVEIGALVYIPNAVWVPGLSGNDNYAFIQSVTDQGNGSTRLSWSGQGYGTAQYGPGIPVTIINYIKEQSRVPIYFVVQLKKLDGGNYGSDYSEKAYGNIVEENYGSYAYTKLGDVVNNFLVAYVGSGKLIQDVKRTDVIFHAKRAMQEFSYDTLKSVNSQELTIPHNLSVILPQDYVNYVNIYWVDNQGVQHIVMPTNNLTSDPYSLPLQDGQGVPTQDNFDNNIEGTSIVEDRWKNNFFKNNKDLVDDTIAGWEYYYGAREFGYGQMYGLDPQYSNGNGYFTINDREGKISFSANLVDKIIVFEYISDGLSTNIETRVPKLAEEAMYAYISHAVIASRINQPEYIVQRLKREASAKLRNTKIRLSNIKLNEIVQVMRGKSKWLKH